MKKVLRCATIGQTEMNSSISVRLVSVVSTVGEWELQWEISQDLLMILRSLIADAAAV